ncbi:PAS domain S-box protein [Halovivax sp.]|uniref:PAS domain S-box protein n=1 Tax=Halovivax sp. TaxID=1935978 RepID=UPI0025C12790|nr:PAS domain S-box protein [Halovivax sp.]
MSETRLVVYVGPSDAEPPALTVDGIALEVEHVRTVDACLARLERSDGVIVADAFPDEGAPDRCRTIRERDGAVPILVYAEDGSEALAGEVVAAGADGYVPASAGVGTLETRLTALLGGRDAPDSGDSDASELDFTDPGASGLERRRRSPAWAALVVEQSPLAIVEWDLDFEAVSWNPAATELFGYGPREAIGELGPELLVPPEDRDQVHGYWEDLFDTRKRRRGVNRNLRKDGSVITCEWFNTPLIDEDGEIVGVLSFAQDVTDEIRRAEALETLQETTHRLMRARSKSEIADVVIEAAESVIDRPRAGIRYYDPESGTLELATATEDLDERADATAVGPGDGLLWETFERGEPTVIEDASAEMVPYDLDLPLGNAIVQPVGDRGLLTVASAAETTLSDAEFHLVQVLASTAEVAIERAERDRELERAKTIVEAVGDGVYALDAGGRFTTVNDTLASMTGYAREDLVGIHGSTILSPESADLMADEVEGMLSSERDDVFTREVEVVTADGGRLPCEVSTAPLRTDGELAGTVGIVRDVSERKAMERELLDRQHKIANLHEVVSQLEECETEGEIYDLTVEAAEGVLNFDVCVVSTADDSYLEIEAVSSHVDQDRFRTRRHVDVGLSGKTYRERRTFRIDDVANSPDANPQDASFESALSVPMGEYGVFQTISTEPAAFDDRDEELAELLISHVTDVLDRLRFEEQLLAERDRFAVLFEHVPDAVVTGPHVGEELIVERVNSAFERIFGVEEAEIRGEPLDDFIVPPDRREEAERINERSESGAVVETEVKRRTADGLRDFMLRVVPFEVEDEGEHAFGVYTDITEQKQRQKRVEVLNRVLRHDLRNGMNIIEGSAEMLAAAADTDDAEIYAEAIRERTRELIGLAEKTRAVERTLDRGEAATGPVDVVEAVEVAIERLVDEYPNASVSRSIPDRAFVRADDLLEEAIFHVVENAAEHTDRSDPEIEISLDPSAEDEDVVLRVADDGPGIPDEERALLEEEREITQLRHASGLGLWLVDWVVTQSGGELAFAENEPRGTVVELQLPAATDAKSDAVGAGVTIDD